jgi:hypothetical protein
MVLLRFFIFTKFKNQFQKLKNGDYQIKFIRKQASSVIVGARNIQFPQNADWIGETYNCRGF